MWFCFGILKFAMKNRVQHILNRNSVKFLLGFSLVVTVVMLISSFFGRYIEDEMAIEEGQGCPQGESC